MMVIDSLNKLEAAGVLKELTDVGIIPTKYYIYREYYLKYIHYTSSGMTKMEVYTLMSDRYRVSERTLMRACRAMEELV